jgi:hypothetical protein
MKRESPVNANGDNNKRQKYESKSNNNNNDQLKDVTLPISMEEIQFHRDTLQRKHQHYCKFLGGNIPTDELFWNLVVITASDQPQKEYYESQLRDRIDRNEIPSTVKYHVVADPPGPKFGSGGSTMFVLDFLQKLYPNEISNCKCFNLISLLFLIVFQSFVLCCLFFIF